MKHIIIRRRTAGSYLVLGVALAAHFSLSWPAATCRGFPPINPFWYVAPFIGSVGIAFLPLFDDDPRKRRIVRNIYSVGALIAIAWVWNNTSSGVPHSNNPVGSLFYAVFLSIPVIAIVFVLERLFATFWMRCRGFTDEESDASQIGFRFSTMALFTTVFVIAGTLATTRWYVNRSASLSETVYQSRSHLLRLAVALGNYQFTHGRLPYDERGSEAALYLLRDTVDVSTFDGAPRKRNPAKWDEDSKVLVNGDFAYLNVPVTSQSNHRVVACTMPIGKSRLVFYTSVEGFVRWIELPSDGVQQLLGSWITVEGELVADAQTFTEWCKTHPFFSGQYSITGDNYAKVLETSAGVTIRCRYKNGRLFHCTIVTPMGEIKESVKTDNLGRIVDVVREPEDWQRVASSPTPVASPE